MPQHQPFPNPRPSEEERRRLLQRYAEHRRPADLERLVLSYESLACSLARRYSRGGPAEADLEQSAREGLVKAIKRFDPSRGAPFTSFAVPTILGEVRRLLRDTSWTMHVPRAVQERVRALREASARLSARTGRQPTVEELAAVLGCSAEDVLEARFAASSQRTVALDGAPETEEGLAIADLVGDHDPGYEQVECLLTIDHAFPGLSADEQEVIRLHFGDDLSQRQIAAELGVSRSQVGRLLGRGIERLRTATAA